MSKKDALLAAIKKELKMIASQGKVSDPIETIYFGGGTPSLFVDEIGIMLQNIFNLYEVSSSAEITIEMNPDDIIEEKLIFYKKLNINRLSIGIQSFFEDDLLWMNRAHTAQQAINGLKLALQYFENITIDLIYGTPGLTNEKWEHNVETAINLGIPHLSCYALTVEPQTPLDKLIRLREKEDVNSGLQAEQFLLLMDWAKNAGFEHYEISNFAKPGFRSRHNSAYWKGTPYYGFGPSAHSYNGIERSWNVSNNQKYIDAIDKDILPLEKEVLSRVQKLNEHIMISLRTIEGVDLSFFSGKDKSVMIDAAKKHLEKKYIIIDGDKLRLTDQGKLFADSIAADLFFSEKV